MSSDRANSFIMRLGDEESLEVVRIILRYEALMRGCSQGEALFELLMGAIDRDSYPAEIRDRIG